MQHIEQLALVEGQLEYRRESGGQRLEPRNIGVARDRKHGRRCRVRSRTAKALRELRIFARAVEHRAVIGLRQADFGDEPRHTFLDVRDRYRRGPPAREHTVEGRALGLREADEQDPGAGELAGAGTHALRLLLQLQLDPESAAEADCAFQPDLAAHQADELLRDGSAQPCAAEAAGGGLVRLRKAFEDARLRLRRNTDPRVADGELEAHAGLGFALRGHMHGHAAALGELHRVASQVDQDLPQVMRVAAHRGRHLRHEGHHELHALGCSLGSQNAAGAVEERVQVEISLLQRNLAGLDLREVENVFDEAQHHAR